MEQQQRDELFVKTWIEAAKQGHNTVWIAEQLQLNQAFVRNRAETLRKRGVKLPNLPRRRSIISEENISVLNKLIEGE